MTENSKQNTYEDVCGRILAIPKFTKEKHGFEVIRAYLEGLGHPEQGMRIYHVAGTNGKGSVTRMLSDLLLLGGRRTGMFTSPHLVRMNERISVDGKDIADEDLVSAYEQVERLRIEKALPQLTFFEILFVMALLHFRAAGVTDAVLETGLGGRLDATTSVPADLYVITKIGLDHTAQLGDTIEEVAGEKAGIITGDSPLILHASSTPAEQVILARAEAFHCRAVENCNTFSAIIHGIDRDGIDFSFSNGYDSYDHLFLKTRAQYQVENAVTAITAAPYLFPEADRAKLKELLRKMLSRFSMPGRMEEIAPGIYVDGAHNPSAARELLHSLYYSFTNNEKCSTMSGCDLPVDGEDAQNNMFLIFAASNDKDYREVLRILLDFPWKGIILTEYRNARSVPAGQLAEAVADILLNAETVTEERHDPVFEEKSSQERHQGQALIQTAEDVRAALNLVKNEKGSRVMVTGSLYLVGEIKALPVQNSEVTGVDV